MTAPDSTPRPEPAWLQWLAPIAIVLVGWLAYADGFAGQFVFDDHTDITDNVAIRSLSPLRAAVFEQGQSGVAGRPLVALSYALNYAWDPPAAGVPLDPASWHFVNVTIHLLAALLAYGCVRRALVGAPFGARWSGSASAFALASALVWVAHPLSTGVVMYRGQRVESMMALCFLATFYCALRAFAAPRSKGWVALAVLACALGTACKEVIVAAPLLVYLYDAVLVSRAWGTPLRFRRGLYLGLFASWILIATWVALAQGRSESVGFGYGHVGVWSYLTTQAWAVPRYLRLVAWPHPLIFDYGVQPITDFARWGPGAALTVALLAGTVWGIARRHPLGFLGAWWFLILAPSSSFLPIVTELIVEHRAYLPSLAPLVASALALHALLGRLPSRVAVSLASAVVLVATAGGALLTRARVQDYSTEIGLWADTVAKLPTNARAHASYGNDLRVAGQVLEAGEHYREAVRLAPQDGYWRANLGTWLMGQGRIDEAIGELERSRELLPQYGMTLQNLGSAYQRRGDLDAAMEAWSAALDHGAPAAAFVAQQLAALYGARGREAEAVDAYRRAARSAPDDPELLLGCARMLLQARDTRLRDPALALSLAQRAFALRRGTDGAALELAAEALLAQSRTLEAGNVLQQAAGVWSALGQPARARAAQARAEQLARAPR